MINFNFKRLVSEGPPLKHNKERLSIANAGYHKCIECNYSNEGMIRNFFITNLNHERKN